LEKSDIEVIFKVILVDKNDLVLPDPNKSMMELIFEKADEIEHSTDNIVELENKIILSIAIRLKAEMYMVREINDPQFCEGIVKNQTAKLVQRYGSDFPNEKERLELLKQVNLMTPENIHINSFMYEPILDMANDHLKQLYRNTKIILN